MPSLESLRRSEETIELALRIARCVEPGTHVPGRIQMRVSLWNLPQLTALIGDLDVKEATSFVPGLKGYEITAWSLSATIHYDPEVLPFDFWNNLCRVRNDPQAERLVRHKLLSVFESHSIESSP